MAEIPDFQDEASRYVLGQLGGVQLRRFEARLEQSAELRALVRGLQEGIVGLAMTAPRREPPAQVWQGIEESVAKEANRKVAAPASHSLWLWSGWAAAACLLGFLFLSTFGMRHSSSPPTSTASLHESGRETVVADSPRARLPEAVITPMPSTNVRSPGTRTSPTALTDETVALRKRLADLQGQVNQMSQALAQQQALLSASSRLSPFQLMPPNSEGSQNAAAPPSPEVQRALLLALARELGWLHPSGGGQSNSLDFLAPGGGGIDFVDLPPANGNPLHDTPAPSTNLQAQAEAASGDGAEAAGVTNSPSKAVPGFVYGNDVVMVFPPSIVSQDSGPFTIWSGSGTGVPQSQGSVALGGTNTTVVTFSAGDGSMLSVTSGSSGVLVKSPP